MNQVAVEPVVKQDRRIGLIYVDSRDIAKCFNKRHDHVLSDIRSLRRTHPEFKCLGVFECGYHSRGKIYPSFSLSPEAERFLKDRYSGRYRLSIQAYEDACFTTIEQINNTSILRQFRVGSYLVDGYDPQANVVYEIDGPEHYVGGKLKDSCVMRQKYVEERLGCKFKRIKVGGASK